MRIGICGAQSTGKTTLLNELKSRGEFSDYKFCIESTREIQRLGLNINERGDDITQRIIMQHHFFNLMMYDNMVADRTIYDCFAYTRYLNETGQVSNEMVQLLSYALTRALSLYDIIFYIEPEFDIEDDGVRSTNVSFRNRIDEIFKEILQQYQPTKLVRVFGTVQNRALQVINSIKETQQ